MTYILIRLYLTMVLSQPFQLSIKSNLITYHIKRGKGWHVVVDSIHSKSYPSWIRITISDIM